MKKAALIILWGFSTLAMANWLELGSNDAAVIKIDTSTIKRNPYSIEAWVLFDLKKPRQIFEGDRDFYSGVARYEYDCTENKARFLEKYAYTEKNGQGDQLFSSNKPENWLSIAPNVLNFKAFTYLCRPK
jgi:hypothetical protein